MYPAHKQVPLLLESMNNCGLASLRKFLEVLRETGHRYLADLILDTEAIPVADVRPGSTSYANPLQSNRFADSLHLHSTHTSHSPVRGHGSVVSLGHLLRRREDRETAPRGAVIPRTLLTDPVTVGYQGPAGGMDFGWKGGAVIAPQYAARSKEDVPGTLYNLGMVR